jgi:PAS domain S-box-containing protein
MSTLRILRALTVGAWIALACALAVAAQEIPRRILVVQSQPVGDLFHSVIVSTLIGDLPRTTPRAQVFVEALDSSRLAHWRGANFRRYLELKYGSAPFDIVITVGSPAASAMRGPGADWVARTPWVVVNAGPSELEELRRRDNVVPMGNVGAEFAHNIRLIKALVPDTEHIVVVGRAATPQIQTDIQAAITDVGPEFASIERWDEGRDTVLRERLHQAPPHTAVFLAGWLEDASGLPLQGRELLSALAPRIRQPVFTAWDFVLGEGIIGGKLISANELGKRTAAVVSGLLAGQTPSDFAHLDPVANHHIFDYRALERHGIAQSRLPAGSEIRYRPPSLAESNPVAFFSGLALIAVLTTTLAATVVVLRTRRRAAEESARNERQFRMLFDANPTGLLVFDTEGLAILATNRRVEEILGPTIAVRGAPISALGFIPVEDHGAFESDVQLHKEQHRRYIAERRLIRSNGETVICEMLTHAIDYYGRPARLVMINDITQRVEAENQIADQNEFLNTLLNTIPQPVFWKGADGRYLGGNQALSQVFGRPLSEIIGRTLTELTPDADFQRYVASDAQLIAHPGIQRFEDQMVFADTVRHDVLISKATYRHLGNQVAGLAGTITDISHIKRIEAQLREANAALEQKVEERTTELASANDELHKAMQQLVQREKLAALGTLVAGVAHELNTPLGNTLTVITTLESLLQNFQRDVEQGTLRRSHFQQFLQDAIQACEMVERNAQRAAELVASFKLVAVDQASARRRAFDLHTLIRDTLKALAHVHKGLPVHVETDVITDITLDSFPGAVEQVITNLLLNAVTHGRNGQAPLRVRLRAHTESETGMVILAMEDDGVGMDADTLHRAFDPFFTTRLGQGGSGLGLYIVYNLVHGVLGGTVAVESRPGAGTRFKLRIPKRAPEDVGQA